MSVLNPHKTEFSTDSTVSNCDIRHINSPLRCATFSPVMETEHQLCVRFEAELASIAALDRVYYLNPCPTLDGRRNYAARQIQLEEIRSKFYLEFGICHQVPVSPFHSRCRSIFRRTRLP